MVVFDELESTSALIYEATGTEPAVWRAPAFATDARIDDIAAGLKLRHVGADVVPDDWSKTDPEQIAARVTEYVEDGSIVCLHDGMPPDGGNGTSSRQATVDAVALILERLAGWEFVTVSELDLPERELRDFQGRRIAP